MSEQKKLILYGIGKLSEILFKLYEMKTEGIIAGFTVDDHLIDRDCFMGRPVIRFSNIESTYPPRIYDMQVAIGYKNMRNREKLFEKAKKKGYFLPNYIGPTVNHFNDTLMGENNIIFNGAYLGPDGVMGHNNIIRPNAYIGHDFKIGDHNFIAPGCNIAGYVHMGNLSFIGIGATIVNRINLADETFLTASSLLLNHTEPCCQYSGVPGKMIKRHDQTGIVIH